MFWSNIHTSIGTSFLLAERQTMYGGLRQDLRFGGFNRESFAPAHITDHANTPAQVARQKDAADHSRRVKRTLEQQGEGQKDHQSKKNLDGTRSNDPEQLQSSGRCWVSILPRPDRLVAIAPRRMEGHIRVDRLVHKQDSRPRDPVRFHAAHRCRTEVNVAQRQASQFAEPPKEGTTQAQRRGQKVVTSLLVQYELQRRPGAPRKHQAVAASSRQRRLLAMPMSSLSVNTMHTRVLRISIETAAF